MKHLFDTVRAIKGAALTQADVDALNTALGVSRPALTPRRASSVMAQNPR